MNQNPDLEKEIARLDGEIKKIYKNPPLATHSHTGFDMDKVLFSSLSQRFDYMPHTIAGTAAATGTNYGVFFIAPAACVVIAFREVHQTAGSDGGAVTLQLEKLTSGVAPDSGTELLATALSLKATANTVQTASLTTTATNLYLASGDRLALKDAGTLTAVANVTVLLGVQYS